MFECVINISEGKDSTVLVDLDRTAGPSLRNRHSDAFHHRSVFTLINTHDDLQRDVRSLITRSYELIDLSEHRGVHPRFGVVDVVPFVALQGEKSSDACVLRDSTAHWMAEAFHVPVFLYGALPDGSLRTLPDVRRRAFRGLLPDLGPSEPAASRGSSAVGCREILVAWNLWLGATSIDTARAIASQLRQPALRTLAFEVGDAVQVSCNIIDVHAIRVSDIYDEVLALLADGASILRVELVGLAPKALLEGEDPLRWSQLGLSPDTTIEAFVAR